MSSYGWPFLLDFYILARLMDLWRKNKQLATCENEQSYTIGARTSDLSVNAKRIYQLYKHRDVPDLKPRKCFVSLKKEKTDQSLKQLNCAIWSRQNTKFSNNAKICGVNFKKKKTWSAFLNFQFFPSILWTLLMFT